MKTTNVLLIAVALLLGLNLNADRQEAEAGPRGGLDGACCLPNGSCLSIPESQCDALGGEYYGEGFDCGNANCIQQLPPTVVGSSATQVWTGGGSGVATTPAWRIFRAWSDGTVDTTYLRFDGSNWPNVCDITHLCGPAAVLPGTCPADSDRNGAVDAVDFLDVLSSWGPCP